MTNRGTLGNADRFQVRVTADSHFAWLRTRLAVERTMMSWLRTGVSLIGFGFAIVQFFERLDQMSPSQPALHPIAPKYLGLALIGAGILSVLIAGMGADAMQSPVIAVGVLLTLIGAFAFSAVLLRLV